MKLSNTIATLVLPLSVLLIGCTDNGSGANKDLAFHQNETVETSAQSSSADKVWGAPNHSKELKETLKSSLSSLEAVSAKLGALQVDGDLKQDTSFKLSKQASNEVYSGFSAWMLSAFHVAAPFNNPHLGKRVNSDNKRSELVDLVFQNNLVTLNAQCSSSTASLESCKTLVPKIREQLKFISLAYFKIEKSGLIDSDSKHIGKQSFEFWADLGRFSLNLDSDNLLVSQAQ